MFWSTLSGIKDNLLQMVLVAIWKLLALLSCYFLSLFLRNFFQLLNVCILTASMVEFCWPHRFFNGNEIKTLLTRLKQYISFISTIPLCFLMRILGRYLSGETMYFGSNLLTLGTPFCSKILWLFLDVTIPLIQPITSVSDAAKQLPTDILNHPPC